MEEPKQAGLTDETLLELRCQGWDVNGPSDYELG